jgi:hypothetical protein
VLKSKRPYVVYFLMYNIFTKFRYEKDSDMLRNTAVFVRGASRTVNQSSRLNRFNSVSIAHSDNTSGKKYFNIMTPKINNSVSSVLPKGAIDTFIKRVDPLSVYSAIFKDDLSLVSKIISNDFNFKAEESDQSPFNLSPLKLAFSFGRHDIALFLASQRDRDGNTALHRLAKRSGMQVEIGDALSSVYYLEKCPSILTGIQNNSGELPGHSALRNQSLHSSSRNLLLGFSPLDKEDHSGNTISQLAIFHPDPKLRHFLDLGKESSDRLFIPGIIGKASGVFVPSEILLPYVIPTFTPGRLINFDNVMQKLAIEEANEIFYFSINIGNETYWINPTVAQFSEEGRPGATIPNMDYSEGDFSVHYHPTETVNATYKVAVKEVHKNVVSEQKKNIENNDVQRKIKLRANIIAHWNCNLPSDADLLTYELMEISQKPNMIFTDRYKITVELTKKVDIDAYTEAYIQIRDEIYRLDSDIDSLEKALEKTQVLFRDFGVLLTYSPLNKVSES